MELYHESFDLEATLKHIDEVLATVGDGVKKFPHIPNIDDLGDLDIFITTCTVVYIKIRLKSSFDNFLNNKLVTFRQRESFQSAVTSILREHPKCFDFLMHDDEIACIVDTPFKEDINMLFEQLAKINSMLSILNKKSQLAGLEPFEWGIGSHYGETFVSSQRYHDGPPTFSWSGYAYSYSRHLSGKALDNNQRVIFVSKVFYDNLKEEYQELMRLESEEVYTANVINRFIQNWQTENLDKK